MSRLIAHPAVLPSAAAALVLAIIAIATSFAGIYQNRVAWVTHTLQVERELARFQSTVQEGELAARGYVLTGEQDFLLQFNKSRAEAPKQLDGIAQLTTDNAEQQASIPTMRTLLSAKFDSASLAIGQRQAGATQASITTFVSGRGRELGETLTSEIKAMESRESRLMNARSSDERNTGTLFLFFGGLTILAALVIIVLWFRDRRRSNRAMQQAFTEQEAALANLRRSQDDLMRESSARAAVEGQLRQIHKMEAVGQLTGGIAHDFNNMLAVIMSSVTLTKKKIARGDHNIAAMLDAAMDAAGRAAKLTQRLLAFSRQQPLSPELLDANKFVAGLTDLLQSSLGEHIQVETVLAGGLWKICADASQLENAILNLAVNARDAMTGGGKLTVETANVALDDAYARANAEVVAGQYVMVAVSDSGAGMAPDVIDRAFDPFFTTKPVGAGTGLGLSQVFGFVKQSGGSVKIYSEIGRGTTVKIYLPRHFGEMKEVEKPKPIGDIRREDICEIILVVEDEHRLREMTSAGLRDLGYTVLEAPNGTEALKIFDANPDLHCLFTDIVMPDMTGRQLADEASRRRPGLKVLYTTGYTRNAVVHNGVLDPGVSFLPKPFTLDQLAVKLREVLGPPLPRNKG